MSKAPRPPMRMWQRLTRGAGLAVSLWLAGSGGAIAAPQIIDAAYIGATGRYDHLVLGKDHNWAGLQVRLSDGTSVEFTHEQMVFEDTAPRVVDLDADGAPEVITVESSFQGGARLAIYGLEGSALVLLAATPPIGRSHRWLAVAGIGDLDGDGTIEIAYVDRPHLAKTLRIWTYQAAPDPKLVPRGAWPGFTNHQIGSPIIEGGLKSCGNGPELILPDAPWQKVMAVRFDGHTISARDLGTYRGPQSVTCP